MIADRTARVRERIADACARAGRAPEAVTMVAVSKTKSIEMILEAAAAGVQHFGESRVEESSVKIPVLRQRSPVPLTWHMIGHIQSRKARDVLPDFDLVHSLDSMKLAEKLSRLAQDGGRVLPVLVQMNVSGEESKFGFAADGWESDSRVLEQAVTAIRGLLALPALELRGLMTIAPFVDDPQTIRPVFASLRNLRDALQESTGADLPELSMGMTDDYEVAIEEGATLVRIGRAIFGERDTDA
jgi:PLP dependent protein